MLLKFIFLCLIFILVGCGYIVYKQPALRDKIPLPKNLSILPNLPAVKGISTSKAGSISGELSADVGEGLNQVQKKALEVKIGDIVNFFKGTQKIASDTRGFQDYLKEQVDSFGKK